MRAFWVVYLAAQLSRDSYISAVPKGKVPYLKEDSSLNISHGSHTLSVVTMLYRETPHRQKIRHKSLVMADSVEDADTAGEDDTASDKEIIMAKALPVRNNRTKSTLDKLVREPELGKLYYVG